MRYEVEFRDRVLDLLVHWQVPEPIMDELERFADERLAVDPATCLKRLADGKTMQCSCSFLEPESSRIHFFLLRAHYTADEKTVVVYDIFCFVHNR